MTLRDANQFALEPTAVLWEGARTFFNGCSALVQSEPGFLSWLLMPEEPSFCFSVIVQMQT